MQQRVVMRLLLSGLCLLGSMAAEALTLGDMVVHSRPGQPLRAIIPVTLDQGEALAQIRVELATVDEYEEQQLARKAFLEGMRFALLDRGEGHARIQLYGERPWQGEEAQLLLRISWPQGQLNRSFRLAGVTPASEKNSSRYVEVGDNDTLDAIAIRLSQDSNRSYLHMMYALFKTNPDAFYNGNMNNLKHGVRLQVPSEAEIYRLTDAEVFGGIREQYSLWRQQQPSNGASGVGAALSGMSDKEASALADSESPEALEGQLKQLADDNASMQQRNAELKARLAKLEKQMQQMSQRVLDYPEARPQEEAVEAPPPSQSDMEGAAETPEPLSQPPEPVERKPQADEVKEADALPTYLLFLAMLLSLGAGVLVWRYASQKQQGVS